MIALSLVAIVCALVSMTLSVVGLVRDSGLCIAIGGALAAVAMVLALAGMLL